MSLSVQPWAEPLLLTAKLIKAAHSQSDFVDFEDAITNGQEVVIKYEKCCENLAAWFDEFIQKTLEKRKPENDFLNEYSKTIFQSLLENSHLKLQSYVQVKESTRREYIKDIFTKLLSFVPQDFTPDVKKEHREVFKFLDNVISLLSLDLTIQATSRFYLATADSRDSESGFIRDTFARMLNKNFSAVEAIFYEHFQKYSAADKAILIDKLSAPSLAFKPRDEYFAIAKTGFYKHLEEKKALVEYAPLVFFQQFSTLPSDNGLSKICCENLQKLLEIDNKQDIHFQAIEDWLQVLAKFEEIKLDDKSYDKLKNALSFFAFKQNEDKHIQDSITLILKIILSSDHNWISVDKNLQTILMTLIVSYGKSKEASKSDSERDEELQKQVIYAFMLLSAGDIVDGQVKPKLSNIGEKFGNSIANLSATLVRKFNHEPNQTQSEFSSKLAFLQNSIHNPDKSGSVIDALQRLSFFLAEPQALLYLLSNNFENINDESPLNKIITPNMLRYFIDGQRIKSETNLLLKNQFIPLLISAFGSESKEVRTMAEDLSVLFPEEIIKKALEFISGENKSEIKSGIAAVNYFTKSSNQVFLAPVLQKYPELKTNFKITHAYNEFKAENQQKQREAERIVKFEKLLSSLGFEFKLAA